MKDDFNIKQTNIELQLDHYKLDGVGPVDNKPSTDKLHHFVEKKKCCGGWTFIKNFSSPALTVSDLWYFEDLEEKAHWPN